ncbi:SMR family transporter [Cereibacter azotoformans]|uniref:Small multidrug resistance protein n=1 Tax=Cereibacter sphaeroides (strain ATCC 17025 / ATH 2.4.3) TaxID=349102 RepID=A4WRX1_CERS5|nr:SMR family transporter [Cereibacter azotoformans]ULB09484.1 SMR family transporter [Cereibacter azotoformans]
MPLATTYAFLVFAIFAEVVATTALARSDGFTRLWPSVITVLGYSIAFACLSVTLKVMPTGVVYALWSGLGIVFIAAIGWLVYDERLDLPALIGLGLILAGVLVVNLFSKTIPH